MGQSYNQAFRDGKEKGVVVGSRMTRDRGLKSSNAKEEVIQAEDLKPETKYRIVISVKNTEEDRLKPVTFNLRIEIQENLKSYKG